MADALRQPEVAKIPQSVVEPLEQELVELRQCEMLCKNILNGDFSKKLPVAADLNKNIKTIQKSMAVLETLAKAVRAI